MKQFILSTLALLAVFTATCAGTLNAQSQDSILVTVEHTVLPENDTFVDVRVFGIGEPGFVAFQIGLVWAEDELELQDASFGTAISSLDNQYNLVTPGQFRAVSTTFTNTVVSLAQDTVLLTLRFKTLPGFSGNTPIFSDVAIPTEFSSLTGVVPHSVRQGFISYGEPGMRTSFSEPYADADNAEQFCVDLLAEEAYAIAGFDLNLNWDAATFPLAEVKLGDNPLRLTAAEIPFTSTDLTFDRNPEDGVKFPAILEGATVASLCFTTTDAEAESALRLGGGREENTVSGYSSTGELVVLTNAELTEGTVKKPKTTGIFSPVAGLPSLKIYPNPVSNTVTFKGVDLTTDWQLLVVDDLGRKTHQIKSQRGNTVDLSSLAPGAYTIRVTQGERRWLNRVVVAPR